MLKHNGMVILSEEELEMVVEERVQKNLKEIERRNEFLRKALMKLTTKKEDENNTINNDVRISKIDFLNMYEDALNEMFDKPEMEDNDIYGYDITVHWHGVYCNCSDGATAANYIIPAIKNVYEEDEEEGFEGGF